MCFEEYDLRLKAYELKRLEQEEIHYINAQILRLSKATNKKGEFKVKNLLSKLQKQKRYDKLIKKCSKNEEIYNQALRFKEYKERRGNGEL